MHTVTSQHTLKSGQINKPSLKTNKILEVQQWYKYTQLVYLPLAKEMHVIYLRLVKEMHLLWQKQDKAKNASPLAKTG